MRKLYCFGIVLLLIILSGCGKSTLSTKDWGSFSPNKTQSYDNKYYAVQNIEEADDGKHIVVNIYTTQNDEFVFSFIPARAMDFWGICWENDTYNIWVQSADIGILCYKYKDNEWILDDEAIKPDYIKSKYDKLLTDSDLSS